MLLVFMTLKASFVLKLISISIGYCGAQDFGDVKTRLQSAKLK